MEVELREAAGDFSANMQYDLAGPPVPDTNFAFLWLANVCHLGGGWKTFKQKYVISQVYKLLLHC